MRGKLVKQKRFTFLFLMRDMAQLRTSGSCTKLEQNFPYTENLPKLSITEIHALLKSFRIDY